MVKFVLVVDRCDQMELQTESDWRAGPPEGVDERLATTAACADGHPAAWSLCMQAVGGGLSSCQLSSVMRAR